jgi:hypothetical protein
MPPVIQLVAGAPYSAEQHTQHFHTLPSGTQPNGPGASIRVYRDSRGRTRTERNPTQRPNQSGYSGTPILIIELRDPVAGYQYLFDTQNRVAHRFPLKAMNEESLPPRNSNANPGEPTVTRESLGNQIIDGDPAVGLKITYTYPAGARGNDAPFSEIHEIWVSQYLKIPVLTKTTDPLNYDSVLELKNISRIEPDPNLFIVPAGYAIVDENGPVEIKLIF